MAITGFCYYIDSCMTHDTPASIKISRVALTDTGSLLSPQTQNVPIPESVNRNQRFIGASVQPTPSGLILIGGELDDEPNYCPLSYAVRDPNNGNVTSSFSPISHKISHSLSWCSHFYHVSQNLTPSVYLIGGWSLRSKPSFNIYRILFNSSGVPSSVLFCGSFPGLTDINTAGALSFAQNNRLWILLRQPGKIRALWTELNPDGSIKDSSQWNSSVDFNCDYFSYKLKNGKSYSFSPNGGRFFFTVEHPYGEHCVSSEIIGGDIHSWSIGRTNNFIWKSLATGIFINNGNNYYILKETGNRWVWFSSSAPEAGPYPNFSFSFLHDTQINHGYRDFKGMRLYTFLSGGVTYTAPPNSRPAIFPDISFDYVDGLLFSRSYGEGAVSGADFVVARKEWGYFSADKVFTNQGRWYYSNPDLPPGGHRIYVRAYNQYNNFKELTFFSWIGRHPPSVSVSFPRYKGRQFYISVKDEYAGIKSVEYALSTTYPTTPQYSVVFENEDYQNGIIKTGNFSLISNINETVHYLFVKATNLIELKTEKVFVLNSSSFPSLSPPNSFSIVNGVCKQKSGRDQSGGEFIKVDIWWQYPPPDGLQYAQYEKGFVRYDFNKDSAFSGGTEYGYIAYLYGRWECLVKQNPQDITGSFVPVTNWFPFKGNPIVAMDDDGNWVGTSVLSVTLIPGVNIIKKPSVSFLRNLVVNENYEDVPYYVAGQKVAPAVWRLNLVAYCNGSWPVSSPEVCHEG